MGKYICPYCAETDNFIIDTEIDEESGVTYDKRVRCGNCYKLFTDDLYREFEANNKLGTKDLSNISSRRRQTLYPSHFTPFEVAQARRARSTFHESANWRYEESAKKYPDNWEAVFFAEYYRVVNCSAVENMISYQLFVNTLHRSLHLASSSLSGEELRIAVEEMFDEAMNMVYVFYRHFKEAAEYCLSGQYPGLCRTLCSVDISAIFETMYHYLIKDKEIYCDILYDLQTHSDILDAFGLMKLKYITNIQQRYGKGFYHYPISIFKNDDNILNILQRNH